MDDALELGVAWKVGRNNNGNINYFCLFKRGFRHFACDREAHHQLHSQSPISTLINNPDNDSDGL